MSTSRIAILPSQLADQIAAGEVIERPASVVKELVENALDAGARRIEVEIEGGGLTLIRVTDDGAGMTPEEAHLALRRHATSKLRVASDLFSLGTMGFRGEALPSIAAVSRLVLTTRTSELLAAHRVSVAAGHEQGTPQEVGAPVGTQIEVRDLLFNVPARLKFLKGEATESGHISETLTRLALAFPAVHFKLRQSGRVALDLPGHKNRQDRAQGALASRGRRSGPAVLYAAAGSEFGISVEGYLGAPSESTATPRNVYLLVNRRFIRDRSLLHAAVMGFGELLDRGRYPLLVLHVEIPGQEVDVNVHPQKLEVRFSAPQNVYAAVRHTIRKATQLTPWLVEERREPALVYPLDEGASSLAASEERPGYGRAGLDELPTSSGPIQADGTTTGPASSGLVENGSSGHLGLAEHRARIQQALHFQGRGPEPVETSGDRESADPKSYGEDRQTAAAEPQRAFFSAMDYLSQLHRTYLVCVHEGELILIDQHAAHERLAFERLRAAYGREQIRSQRLLFPVSLDLDPTRVALLQEHHGTIGALGFEVRPFGGRSFALLAGPDAGEFGRGAQVYQDPEKLLHKVLDELETHGETHALASQMEMVLATIACHSVVRAGDILDETRARALLQAMDDCTFYPHCPHGRPVLVRMPRGEIEKRFGRI